MRNIYAATFTCAAAGAANPGKRERICAKVPPTNVPDAADVLGVHEVAPLQLAELVERDVGTTGTDDGRLA